MSYVHEDKDGLAIGALTIHDIIEHNQFIRDNFTILHDAVSKIGDQQIRNKGTIGGAPAMQTQLLIFQRLLGRSTHSL